MKRRVVELLGTLLWVPVVIVATFIWFVWLVWSKEEPREGNEADK